MKAAMPNFDHPQLYQLKALVIKNWWIKRHHGVIGVAVELLFPIVMTLLVAAFFLTASQASGNYSPQTISSISDFTAYHECILRSPLSFNPRNDLANTTYLEWNDKCVLGVSPSFDIQNSPTLAESAYYDGILQHLSSYLKVPVVYFNNPERMFEEARNYTLWGGITFDCRNQTLSTVNELPYAIHISASFLPAAVYPDPEPNVFFSLISNYLARGALKFELSGFLYLQSAAEAALMSFKLSETSTSFNSTSSDSIAVKLWTAPYKSLSTNVPLVILLSASILQISYIPTIFYACFDMVNERKSKTYLKAMGMLELLYHISWAIYIAGSLLVTSIIIYTGSAVLGVMNGIAGRALIIVLLYALSLCSLVFLISTLSRSRQVAAVFILTVIGFVPNSLAIFLTNSSFAAKAIFSLFSPVTFVFSIVECLKQHLIQANKLAVIPDDLTALGRYSMPFGVLMLILDTLIYFLLAWYFHNTYTKKNPRPIYFMFTRGYWERDSTIPDQIPPSDDQDTTDDVSITLENDQNLEMKSMKPDRFIEDEIDPNDFETIHDLSDEKSRSEYATEKRKNMLLELNRLGSFIQAQDPRREYATTRLSAPPGPGLQLIDVNKTFHGNATKVEDHDVHAVRSVTLDAMRNEVLVIAGGHGSGKSTVIQLLAGLIPPTSGRILVEGSEMQQNRRQVRRMMSLCGEHSALIDVMTVKEHVLLASRIKCMPKAEEEARIDHLLKSLNLSHIADESVGNCSMSERRRISLAIAFAGDAKVVLLDDPTSGLDPDSREVIWNVIRAQKAGRTIVVTTHLMSEVDAIADRAAIMRHGAIVAYGSPAFLYRRFGVGYYLNIVKLPTAPVKPIVDFVVQRIKGCKFVPPEEPTPTLVQLTIPFSKQASYPDLFQEMEAQIDAHSNLGIESFTVSLTTLEAVFYRESNILRTPTNAGAINKVILEEGQDMAPVLLDDDENDFVQVHETPGKDFLPRASNHHPASLFQQLRVLVKMRLRMVLRDRRALIFILVVPLISVILIWLASVLGPVYLQLPQILNGTKVSASTHPVSLHYSTKFPLNIPYVSNSTLPTLLNSMSDNFDVIPRLWDTAYNESGNLTFSSFVNHNELGHYIWQNGNPGHRFTAWVVDQWSFTQAKHSVGILFNKSESYSLPISLNLLSNSLLAGYMLKHSHHPTIDHSLTPLANDTETPFNLTGDAVRGWMNSIRLTMAPFDPIPNLKLATYNFDTSLLSSFTLFDVAWALGLPTCLAIVFSLMTQERVRERVMKVKLQQMLMGASVNVVWCSGLMVDALRVLLVYLIIVTVGAIFQVDTLKGVYFGAFVLVLLLAMPSFLFLAYFISRFFRVPKSCFKWILLLYWSMYVIDYVLVFAIQISRLVVLKTIAQQSIISAITSYFAFLNPYSTLSSALFQLSTIKKEVTLKHLSPSFAFLMTWDHLGIHVCFFIIHSIIWALLLFGIGYFETTRRSPKNPTTNVSASELDLETHPEDDEEANHHSSSDMDRAELEEDQDVKRARNRIAAGEYENAVVRVSHLEKAVPSNSWWAQLKQLPLANKVDSFKDIAEQAEDLNRHLALSGAGWWHKTHSGDNIISNVFMVVNPGESFGILGPAGSGKSTLLSLLIGEQTPSSGTIEINGHSIYSNQSQFYKKALISYSPPGDFFSGFDNLTVLENIQLFFSLRNQVTAFQLAQMAEYTLHKMNLKPYENLLCRNLNWKIKRRLSIGIALYSGGVVALLDEPTSHMDFGSKMQMWRAFKDAQETTGVALIVSSGSMNETYVACDHFGVFVKGRIQAMGSKEYMKNRFQEGYLLKILIQDQRQSSPHHLVDNDENGNPVPLEGHDHEIDLEEDPNKAVASIANAVDDFIKENFSNSRKLIAYGRERTFFLGLIESPAWAFDLLETNKAPLRIQEYSLSQTTLVDVYTQFSRNQEIPN